MRIMIIGTLTGLALPAVIALMILIGGHHGGPVGYIHGAIETAAIRHISTDWTTGTTERGDE